MNVTKAILLRQLRICYAAKKKSQIKNYDYQFANIFRQLMKPFEKSNSNKFGKMFVGHRQIRKAGAIHIDQSTIVVVS